MAEVIQPRTLDTGEIVGVIDEYAAAATRAGPGLMGSNCTAPRDICQRNSWRPGQTIAPVGTVTRTNMDKPAGYHRQWP